MNAGDLDRRITLLRPVIVPGGAGSLADQVEWECVAEVWASFKPARDAERYAAGQTGATLTGWFQIRWSPTVCDVNPAWQLDFECGRYGIDGVKPIGRRDGLEITATALVDGSGA